MDECASLPLLLCRMCHNPQWAPSRAGTQDNVSCPPPLPPPPFSIAFLLPLPRFSAAHTHMDTQPLECTHARLHARTPAPHWLLNRLGNGFLLFNAVWSAAPAVTVSEGGLAHTRAHTHSRALTFNSRALLHWLLLTDLSLSPQSFSISHSFPHSIPSLSLSGRPTLAPPPHHPPLLLPALSLFFSYHSSHKQASWIPAGAPRSVHRDCSAIRHICSMIRKAKGAL